ncbi:FAD binding domain-containing protein [Streptomyces sp. NPDC047017]|uniref:FAD binding domain-containing protein n=1 Tax=Streptomyces sp. NPDC047017 TaxID=3155024 RepID=UPI0033F499D9
MDLNTIETWRPARTRQDLVLAPGEVFLGGGTWLYSEPQVGTTGLVDLATMRWPSVEDTPSGGLRIGATCTVAELSRIRRREGWAAHPVFFQAASALLASFKIWNMMTVGGNICRSYAAASMVSLAVALDATALIWTADGGEYTIPVADIPTGNGTNTLAEGDVLRCIDIPAHALRAHTGFRKMALVEIGRSAAVLTGRLDESGAAVFTITAATLRPVVLRYDALPTPVRLREDALGADGYYTDPMGSADWRRAVSAVLLAEILEELQAWN